MDIRPFDRGDTQAVVKLWERCGLLRAWNDPLKDIERKLRVQPELFLVGCVEGRLVAAVMGGYDGHRGSAYYLGVDPEARGKGYGRQIMTELECLLSGMGCPKVNLLCRSENAGVLRFYQALGYAPNAVASVGKRLIADA